MNIFNICSKNGRELLLKRHLLRFFRHLIAGFKFPASSLLFSSEIRMNLVFLSIFLLFACSFQSASAWDNEDLEVFDLVELINQNFYELMAIKQVWNLLRGSAKLDLNLFFCFLGCNVIWNQTSFPNSFCSAPPRQKSGAWCRCSIQKLSLGLRGVER